MEKFKKRAKELELKAEREENNQRQMKLKLANELGSQVVDLTQILNSHSLMRYPIFSTRYARQGYQTEPIRYQSSDGTVKFEISGMFGVPNQVDGNIIRWAISNARRILSQTGVMPEELVTSRYRLLKVMGKATSSKNYKNLESALKRLSGMHVSGNVFNKNEKFAGTLVSFSYTYDNLGQIDRVKMVFHKDFRDHLEQQKSVLALDDGILTSVNPLEIRLKELVRVGMGASPKWEISLNKLQPLCADTREMRYFKRAIKGLKLPYSLSFRKSANGDEIAVFMAQ